MNSSENPQRIGIYGGAFDPIHLGHLVLAETGLSVLKLDKVVFVPSGGNAGYKPERNVADGKDRWEMVFRSIAEHPQFEVSSHEIDQQAFTYTIYTLRHFREINPPGTEIFLMIGGDWKDKLSTWKEGDKLVREFNIALFSRPGYEHPTDLKPKNEQNIYYVNMPLVDLSSSDIRERIKNGEPIKGMVPEQARQYILENRLYTNE